MPLDNTLNVSELLRRLGVKGDSQGSASLLEALRMNLIIGDFSDLVPPLGGPIGGSSVFGVSGIGTVNKWTLQCRSPGGLTVTKLFTVATSTFSVWITDANPFVGPVLEVTNDYSFGQLARSALFSHPPAAAVQPANLVVLAEGLLSDGLDSKNWLGPGQFFNVESNFANATELLSIMWREYPGALNPG